MAYSYPFVKRDPGGMWKVIAYELRNAKVSRRVIAEWVEHKGAPFLSDMKRKLRVHNIMTNVRQIIKLRPSS